MARKTEIPLKFRPERPIYLNTENTKFKTMDEVEEAVEKLRDHNWLCAVGEKLQPFIWSFDNEKEMAEFKKCAADLGIKLISPVIKSDELQELRDKPEEVAGLIVPGAEEKATHEGPEGGRIVVDTQKDAPTKRGGLIPKES